MTKSPWQKMRLEISVMREIVSQLSNEELRKLKDQNLSISALQEVDRIIDGREITRNVLAQEP